MGRISYQNGRKTSFGVFPLTPMRVFFIRGKIILFKIPSVAYLEGAYAI
jgi:hypothetical protein